MASQLVIPVYVFSKKKSFLYPLPGSITKKICYKFELTQDGVQDHIKSNYLVSQFTQKIGGFDLPAINNSIILSPSI